MATLALSLAGQVVGGAVGGPLGATVGRALGALAGAAIDNALFAERPQPAPGADIRLQGSSEGAPIPRLYGWSRLTGNIIWATELEELTPENAGAKGMSAQEDDTEIAGSFAVGLCEGEVQHLGRVWADGQLLETEGLTLRFYRGTATQTVDSLIEAKQGAGQAPAYRGLCYIVFERLPLAQFGNRIPNISVELCRVVGGLEPAIRAVTVIPGATEFGYDPAPRLRLVSPGVTANENTHQSRALSDWTLSIDELTVLCPNLEHVALVVAWFGDDLRCGQCSIGPRVEAVSRDVEGIAWSVAGQPRATTPVVSSHAGGPAYGGTPSDAAVVAAIADLRARGLKVTLYPIILMDIPAGNALPDPYTGAVGQPAYPWRGRITCDPAPGAAGSVDGMAAVAAQVAAFAGTGGGWDYRRMVLHYAGLAAAAGVDALLIGSELRGLTTVRGPGDSFPFVDALVSLAGEVRAIVGAGTSLTYAADWSEYSGYQPGGGDRYFHLDPLWASPAIDAVGIDNYMPLADWRDGEAHADAALWDGPHDPGYLRANIAGGEGFDWYYASDADRIDGVRSPISDGAHGEPWIWRFKDLAGWWGNAHYERIGGVRAANPTAWVPQGKPIWFTELGCAATDKAANQPNVFGDAKSAEHGRPYFSSGAPDGVQQRQFLRAHLDYWSEADGNPQSVVYGGAMVDPGRIYLWTWDARPYPAFPAQLQSWSDGVNHATGHWLTGRLGGMGSDDLLRAIAADYGVELGAVEAVPPLLHGLTVSGILPCREAMAPVLAACGLTVMDRTDGLALRRVPGRSAVTIDDVVANDAALVSRRRPDAGEAVARVALTYPDRERDYLSGTVTALRPGAGGAISESASLVLDIAGARRAAEQLLLAHEVGGDTLELVLPPSALALEAGDAVSVAGQGEGPFGITEIRDGTARRLAARAIPPRVNPAIFSGRPPPGIAAPAARALPVVIAAQLPPEPATPQHSRLLLAATASPWPGHVAVTEAASGKLVARLARNAALGELVAPLEAGQIFTWDESRVLQVLLYSGHLASSDDDAVLAGANRLAVQTDAGSWEIIGFAGAELLEPGRYRLSRLLRGQGGTGPAMAAAAAGNPVVVLNDRVWLQPLPAQWLGGAVALRAYAGHSDGLGAAFSAETGIGPLLPLPPVQLEARRDPGGGDVALSWIRRSRADTDSWVPDDAPHDQVPEGYRVTIRDGGTSVRSFDVATPAAGYAAAEQLADFGALPSAFTFTIAQLSPLFGPGHAAEGNFNG